MYKEHSLLLSPKDEDILWKYMSLPKFLNLLNGKLYFNRVDCFEDVFESTFPKYNELHRAEIYEGEFLPPQQTFEKVAKYAKEHTFVSCFHKNTYESAFMWKLYAGDNGIAIVTNFKRLKDAFHNEKRDICIGDVHYIDYEKEFMPEGNLFYLSMHKRQSFIHENEVRCLFIDPANNQPKGVLIDIDLELLIEKVYISPYAPIYMKNDVEDILRGKGISAEVVYSPLYTIK